MAEEQTNADPQVDPAVQPNVDPVNPEATEAPVVTPPEAPTEAQEEVNEENLSKLTNKVLVEKARAEFNYPDSLANKSSNKKKLVSMILAGAYPNDEYQEPVVEEKECSEDFQDFDILTPATARIVFGGPVINKVAHPFGFSVSEKLTDEEMEKYGAGSGVTYHCVQGTKECQLHTYKIVY